jgi:hypothetical protein
MKNDENFKIIGDYTQEWPTEMLRWFQPNFATVPILQQKWQIESNKGCSLEWRNVPTEHI